MLSNFLVFNVIGDDAYAIFRAGLSDWPPTLGSILIYVVVIAAILTIVVKFFNELKTSNGTRDQRRKQRAENTAYERRREMEMAGYMPTVTEDIAQPSPIIIRRQARQNNTDFTGGTSWLGGLPALGGVAWPRGGDGAALHLLAQIDCASLSALNPDVGFPSKGSLAFFANITEWSYAGKVIHIPTPAGGAETLAPDDLSMIYDGEDWSYSIKGFDKKSAPKKFTRWPVDLLALDLSDYAENHGVEDEGQEELLKAMAQLSGGEGTCDATTYSLGEYLPNGKDPWLWDSAQRFAASLRVSYEGLPKHIVFIETSLAECLIHSKTMSGRKNLTKQQKIEMMETSGKRAIYHQAQLEKLELQKDDFIQFITLVSEWADGQKAWAPMPKQDMQMLNEFSNKVFGYGRGDRAPVFKDIYRTGSVYHSLTDIVNDTLRSVISGAPDVYDLLPEKVKSEVDQRCLFGSDDDWHQVLGIGDIIQTATEENLDKYMLLQINSDYLMSWMWGDVGAIKFWITPENLKNGRWDTVFSTVEGH